MEKHRANPSAPADAGQSWLEIVRRQVESLRFGAVEIIVHDARVIQIEKIERLRFDKAGAVQASEFLKAEAGAKTAPAKRQSPIDTPSDNQ